MRIPSGLRPGKGTGILLSFQRPDLHGFDMWFGCGSPDAGADMVILDKIPIITGRLPQAAPTSFAALHFAR